ncbi:DUF1992 domain-containing protein [Arthrobacter sp. M4]|uniref:DnaJ family domain-containing protein n=1 Tax=Arthrobacter sp. M4 TaxID=218160 RepID=UPI001CDB7261|nr:DUF1992 domain-containing protein [Arthrobacter sp. M4]MCA4135572.1 DUF1992 domain-containing protein [Arthrobacter sp. M4]
MGKASEEFERRMERAAELRAAGHVPTDPEERKAADAAEALRQRRSKVSPAARADYLIRDAMARGEFDNLKYAGKPIPGLGQGNDPDWWIKQLIEREHLTGLGPQAILLRTEDAELDGKLDDLFSEKQVRDTVEDFNRRVIEARRQLLGGPPVITKTRDAAVEVQRWKERREAKAAAAAAESPEPAPEHKKRTLLKKFKILKKNH